MNYNLELISLMSSCSLKFNLKLFKILKLLEKFLGQDAEFFWLNWPVKKMSIFEASSLPPLKIWSMQSALSRSLIPKDFLT